MIFLETFTKEAFRTINKAFAYKLKERCASAYPANYAKGYRGANDGVNDCILAINQVSEMSLEHIKSFLEEAELVLISEARGVRREEYVEHLDRLIPRTSEIRPNDYMNRLHHLRLFVSFLALNKFVILNCLVGSHPKSTRAATRIASTDLKYFLPPLANDLWLGATVQRYKDNEEHIQSPIFSEYYWNYIEQEKLSVDKLNQSFKRLADIVVANGIKDVSEISFDVLISYHNNLINYYNGCPAAYNIKPAYDLLMSGNPDADYSSYDEFIRQRATLRRGKLSDKPNSVSFLGTTKKAYSYIGENVDGVEKVIVPSRDRKTVLDYGYWSEMSGSDSTFNPDNLEQNNLWIAAQHDYIRHTSTEAGTIKQKKARLSILNKYLFSYLPAYFKSGLSGGFSYPERPEDFLHSLFVQRSNVFELDNTAKFTDGFQYPVSIQQFVYDITSSAHKEDTKNNNSGRDALTIISNFFDYLSTLDSEYIKDFRNPLSGKAKKKVGNRYVKNRKYVFSLDYWLGLRSFCSAVTNQMLDEAITSINNGKNSKSNIVVSKDVNVDGSLPMTIGKVNLDQIPKIKLRKNSEHRVATKDEHIYINNHIPWCLITLLLHSGLRKSNALWLDEQECFSLVSQTEREFQQLLVTTDKAKSRSYPVVIASTTMDILKKVLTVKKLAIKSNPNIAGEIPYNGHEDSKWGDVSPLFRMRSTYNDSVVPNHFSEIINEYESFLRRNGVDFEPTTLFVPQLHYSVDEFIHLYSLGDLNSTNCEIEIEYQDAYPVVKCTPITRKTRITPHSLRTMTVSIFAPIVGADIVGNLLTGQCESTVGYYTKALPDSSSKELLNQVIALLGTDSAALNNLVTARISEINQKNFEKELDDCPKTLINKYNAQSISFEMEGESSGHLNGLDALSHASPNNISYYRTHICPVGSKCPKKVIDGVGEKKCFACPLAVITNNHLPSINATIRSLCDEIKTLHTQLDTFDMLETEREELSGKKMELVAEASYWEARRFVIEESNENGIYYVSDEGLQLMHSIIPQNASEQEKLFLRLKETEGVPKLHSEKLKLQASRLRRKIELNAKVRSNGEAEKLSDMEYLAMVLNMKTDLYGLTRSEKNSFNES
ncbi:hypothetical protein [Photobacterium leiognathi]|uniref:hypothetical protein n=1 Tax=Photobacterium leiognathi TaxID=553611 RepID=UPI002739E04D|nr:hypothetical protein [Photobacterium leiognathi]